VPEAARQKPQAAKFAKEFAPGQVKREEGAKSAKEFAPGQQAKEQRASGAKDDGKDEGRGER
jgi:hypothetical protein